MQTKAKELPNPMRALPIAAVNNISEILKKPD
jgi:hypothetical protein